MGYPKFIVFRVRLCLLAAALALVGANQLEQIDSKQPIAKNSAKKVAQTPAAGTAPTQEAPPKSPSR